MNSTPPMAFFRISLVFGAVWPIYCPTSSSRVTDTTLPAPHEAELVQDAGDPQRHRGLAGAGIAGVNDMCSVGTSEVRFMRLRMRSISNSAAISRNPRLDRLEADQLAIELIEHLADADLVEFAAQIDLLHRCRFARVSLGDWRTHLRIHLPP